LFFYLKYLSLPQEIFLKNWKKLKQWINDIISHPKRIAIPILTHPGIEMIGKTVLDAVTDGKVHAEAIIALNERYPSAASTVIMDLTVEAEAFGCVRMNVTLRLHLR